MLLKDQSRTLRVCVMGCQVTTWEKKSKRLLPSSVEGK